MFDLDNKESIDKFKNKVQGRRPTLTNKNYEGIMESLN